MKDSDLIMSMLREKEELLASIFNDLSVASKNAKAFEILLEKQQEGPNKADPHKTALAYTKATKNLYEVQQRVLMVLLVYLSGRNYTSDVATLLNKMGRGEEALQQMLSDLVNRK